MLLVFCSHLDVNVLYSITLTIRKGKHNVILVTPGDYFLNIDALRKDFVFFLSWVKDEILKFQKGDVNKNQDRLIPTTPQIPFG